MKSRRPCFRIYGVFIIFASTLSYSVLALIIYKPGEVLDRSDFKNDNFTSWRRKILSVNDSNKEFSNEKQGEYPPEAFSEKELENGAIVLHIIGICYMFLALSIVCDEFFVPSLHVISDILSISDDVAGATFMAAGGSAPELFTSILGLFVAKTNIGFGTIVGSAVFNVLFVIGMCVVFSKTVLHLTWWPLLRDSIFYACALALLIYSFEDSIIAWWESVALLSVYFLYVLFMYFNERIEAKVKRAIAALKGKEGKVAPQNGNDPPYQNCALQLVIHTLDPISEATAESKLHRLKEILQSEVPRDVSKDYTLKKDKYKYGREVSKLSDDGDADLRKKAMVNNYLSDGKEKRENHGTRKVSLEKADVNNSWPNRGASLPTHDQSRSNSECSIFSHENAYEDNRNERENSMTSFHSHHPRTGSNSTDTQKNERTVRFSGRVSKMSCVSHHGMSRVCLREAAAEKQGSCDEEDEEPLSLEFPKSNFMRLYYIIKFPIVILLFITLPDVRRPKMKKFFVLTFLGSILWIGGFSYLMVWWASTTGDALGIPAEVMGLTFLAAGTSIPDLITSVLVAREGLGDMAVSSSIGSNIFDVTVGLPVPWLFWSGLNSFTSYKVDSSGLFCSTILLFIMLIAVIVSVAIFRWRMTKYLATAMFVLYGIFLTIALLIEFNQIPCFIK